MRAGIFEAVFRGIVVLPLLLLLCSASAGPLDKWDWLHPRPTGANLYGVAAGAGQFIAVGEHESILRSGDGTNWTIVRETIGGTNLNAVCWGNGTFVAVGAQGLVLTSPDGSNWTRRVPFWGTLYSVTYGNGLFIAVGGSDSGFGTRTNWILMSINGISWAQVLNVPAMFPYTSNPVGPLLDVTWGANGFVAVAQSFPAILFSPDGFSWEVATNTPYMSELRGVTYANGRYVATGSYTIVRSTNGIHWMQSTPIGHYNSDVAYGNSLYVIVCDTGVAGYSTNASTWNWIPPSPFWAQNSWLNDITFANGQFVTVGQNGALMSSANGSNWIWRSRGPEPVFSQLACGPVGCLISDPIGVMRATTNFADWTLVRSNASWRGLKYFNGCYIALDGLAIVQVSSNLVDWRSVPTGATNYSPGSWTYGAGKYVFAGTAGALLVSSNLLDYSWLRIGVTNDLGGIAYGNGRFVTVNYSGDTGISADGTTWEYYPRVPTAERCERLTFGNGVFLGINSTGLVVRSNDGLSWQRDVVGTNVWLYSINFVNGLFLAGGQRRDLMGSTIGSLIFASRYGTNWTAYRIAQLRDAPSIIEQYGQRLIAGSFSQLIQSDLLPLLQILRGQELEIRLSAAPGTYRLEGSLNPDGPWAFLTNVSSGGRLLQAADAPRRFYRAILP